MVLEVRLFDTLRKYVPTSSIGVVTVDVPDKITVAGLLQELEIKPSEIKTIVVNGQISSLNYLLEDGDHVGLFPHHSSN